MTGYPEPQYTQTPNALFDDDLRSMGEAELRVTLVIIRKTLGYHKQKPEPISLTQIQEMSGLSRQGAIDGTAAALKRGRIKRDGIDHRGTHCYVVNFADQSTQWTSTSQPSRPALVNPVDTQKKDFKEKEIKKTKPAASSGSPSSKFGYTIGDHAYWVEEHPSTYQTTVHEVEIVRFTAKMIEVRYHDAGKVHLVLRKPSSLSKSAPKLERKTTPLQNAIGTKVFSVPDKAPVGKQFAIRLAEYEREILTIYPKITPEHFTAAFDWKGEFKPGKVETVIKMLGEYRDHLTRTNGTKPPTTVSAVATRAALYAESEGAS